MADIGASVLARLKNKAEESGRSYQLCLQLFCQEEFLRRVERTKYMDNLVLKGGLFLYSLTNFDSRITVDVDFLLRQQPNTPKRLREMLEEIIAVDTGNDFIRFEITSIAPIAAAKKYSGIGAPNVNTYSVETTVAEKLDAILSLMEFSSRMKDYYDLYYLANQFDFTGAVLSEALYKTFENRERDYTAERFEQVMAFADDAAMQKKWKAFIKKINRKTNDFTAVLDGIQRFLKEPYEAAIRHMPLSKMWIAANPGWRIVS